MFLPVTILPLLAIHDQAYSEQNEVLLLTKFLKKQIPKPIRMDFEIHFNGFEIHFNGLSILKNG